MTALATFYETIKGGAKRNYAVKLSGLYDFPVLPIGALFATI